MSTFQLTSPAFENNELIPKRYTCDGENISPPLEISNVPEQAKTLALIVTDPDIPDEVRERMGIEIFDHWVVFNIPADKVRNGSGGINPDAAWGTLGVNSAGEHGYTGPCPPAEYQPTEHRYIFSLYALDDTLPLQQGARKADVMEAMKGQIVEKAELVGRYEKVEA